MSQENVRVIACSWAPGNEPTFCVALDPEGEPVAHLKLSFINCRNDDFAPPADKRRKDEGT
jgi:hypothetical protein